MGGDETSSILLFPLRTHIDAWSEHPKHPEVYMFYLYIYFLTGPSHNQRN